MYTISIVDVYMVIDWWNNEVGTPASTILECLLGPKYRICISIIM
jgi:hypothetical protein